jgi:hypothetical protein
VDSDLERPRIDIVFCDDLHSTPSFAAMSTRIAFWYGIGIWRL